MESGQVMEWAVRDPAKAQVPTHLVSYKLWKLWRVQLWEHAGVGWGLPVHSCSLPFHGRSPHTAKGLREKKLKYCQEKSSELGIIQHLLKWNQMGNNSGIVFLFGQGVTPRLNQ